jgi:aminopeptidase
MTDIRLKRLADLLVNYSAPVEPGDWVGISGDVCALPALREVHAATIRAGGNPTVMITDDYMLRDFLRYANDEQMAWVDPSRLEYVKHGDVSIRIAGVPNTRAKTSIPPKRFSAQIVGQRPIMDYVMDRGATLELKTTVTLYPTDGWAQEAGMSLEEYEDFCYGAYFCDREDPVAEWKKLGAFQQEKIDWLKGHKHVRVEGPNIDLELSIEDRIFINDAGVGSITAGEIYTGPIEDSVNGWVRFDFPSIARGRLVDGIELRFKDGKIIDAHAKENEAALLAQLDADEGARYLGEFAIGTNYNIKERTGQILFDEKMGGTVHVAVGASYPDTGGKNRSAVHWDMVSDLRKGGRILVDGELFHENGQFVV